MKVGIQFVGALSIALWAAVTSFIYFKIVDNLGKLRVSKFYEVVGIDIVMHTMSDQIGDNDDFDRNSRNELYSNNEYLKQINLEDWKHQDN